MLSGEFLFIDAINILSNNAPYASTTGSLNWVIRSASDVETNIVSVERVLSYIHVEPEAPYEIPESKPDPQWPQAGVVTFE